MAIRRIDHVLCEVPSIEDAFRFFSEELALPVAWPVGRFWPDGRMAGIGLGGMNLELIEWDAPKSEVARIQQVAFEPTSNKDARILLERMGVTSRLAPKHESDPELLRLRGFSEEGRLATQLICSNVIPEGELPFDFFFCTYGPILTSWLSPENPRLQTDVRVESIVFGTPHAKLANRVLRAFKPEKGPKMEFVERETKGVLELKMSGRPLSLGGFPSEFEIDHVG